MSAKVTDRRAEQYREQFRTQTRQAFEASAQAFAMQARQTEIIKLHQPPNAAGFLYWKRHAHGEVVGASGHPEETSQWITFTETTSLED